MNGMISLLVIFAAIVLPMTAALTTVTWLRWLYRREGRRSPLRDKMAHLPGEQLRQRMAALGDKMDERLMQLLILGPATLMVVLLPRVKWTELRLGWIEVLVVLFAIVCCIWNISKLVPLWRERRRCRDGMRAEVAAAQQLDRLQMQGCLVLHDIPAERSNLDHVVVGPVAVFMVETKSRRKQGEGKASANVVYDGKALRFPGDVVETKPLDQARAQAKWLANYLRGETGEAVHVVPVICLPGWYVTPGQDSARSDVRVINPKMDRLFVETGSRPRLEPAQRERIVNALYKRYPEPDFTD